MPLGARAAELFGAKENGRCWYCGIEGCNGEPHEGAHWCEHPIDSPNHTWECRHARASQVPPVEFATGDAMHWLLMGGRGFGKTRSAAEWLADEAKKWPRTLWGVLAPTFDDAEGTCWLGESGLLRALDIDPDSDAFNKTKLRVRLPNGTVIRTWSAEKPERVRGPNLSGVWGEEPGTWKSTAMWDNVFPAIRRAPAKCVWSTTPKPVPMITQFTSRQDGSVVISRGSTFDNQQNLEPKTVAELKIRWQGTRRERQELFGELLEDVPGALWTPAAIESSRLEFEWDDD